MTATHVGGLAVIEDEPTLAPIKNRGGGPIYWKQIRQLLLSDGSVVHGCVHCDFTTDRPARVRSHLARHSDTKPGPKPGHVAASRQITLSDLLSSAKEIEKVRSERDAWKARAVKAERELATVRRVLNGTTS